MSDDEEARKRRAERLRRKIDELTSDVPGPDRDPAVQRPDESDAEYVERRMREIARNAPKS